MPSNEEVLVLVGSNGGRVPVYGDSPDESSAFST
jgi:hypothetical protein